MSEELKTLQAINKAIQELSQGQQKIFELLQPGSKETFMTEEIVKKVSEGEKDKEGQASSALVDSPESTNSKPPVYKNLGVITADENGELLEYCQSQFVKDYAKTHTHFSLYGLMFPEDEKPPEFEINEKKITESSKTKED